MLENFTTRWHSRTCGVHTLKAQSESARGQLFRQSILLADNPVVRRTPIPKGLSPEGFKAKPKKLPHCRCSTRHALAKTIVVYGYQLSFIEHDL